MSCIDARNTTRDLLARTVGEAIGDVFINKYI
jgi:hypothetical protein